jgi:hypothetical protein
LIALDNYFRETGVGKTKTKSISKEIWQMDYLNTPNVGIYLGERV